MRKFVHQDAEWAIDATLDLGMLTGELNRVAYRRGMAEILADYAALPLSEWSFADALLRVARSGKL